MFERALYYVVTCQGGRIGFYAGEIPNIMADIKELKPTIFISVPRLYNRIHDKIMAGVANKACLSRWLFSRGLENKYTRKETTGSITHWMYDSIVFNKLKSMMGGSLRFMITGGAPLAAEVQCKLAVMFIAPLLAGYGLTESMAASFVSHPNDPECGHIGGVIASLEFKLISQPDLQYFVDSDPPKGELCIRGPAIFKGYFGNKEETRLALDDEGWLHTGDIALIQKNGSVKIIDRRKNIFKLAQGEYVAPEKIEGVYGQSPFVGQIFVTGYSTENCLVAIVVPDEECAKKWASTSRTKGVTGSDTFESICSLSEFKAAIMLDMQGFAKEGGLKGFENVKDIYVWSDPFTEQNELLTPTSKLKRNIASEKFKKQIEEMYATIAKNTPVDVKGL